MDLPDCLSCAFFDGLWTAKVTFAQRIYWQIAPWMSGIVSSGLVIWIILKSTSTYLKEPGQLGGIVRTVFIRLILAAVIVSSMTWGIATHENPLVYKWIFDPLESIALSMGADIVGGLGSGGGGNPSNPYSLLAGRVEKQVVLILQMVADLITASSVFSINMLDRLVGGVLIALPYLFVWGLFVAFMLEAMFKFVAAGIIAPLALPAVLFEITRSFSWATLRVLVGAFLTIIFAAGAMGFTMGVVDEHAQPLIQRINAPRYEEMARQRYVAECQGSFNPRTGSPGGPSGGSDACNAAWQAYREARETTDQVNGQLVLWSPEFFFLFVIGLASILLHIQAKSLASNISGANDGAGPAAAVVGGGKMALGAAAMMTSRSGFGQGGAGSSISNIMNSNPVTSAISQHGLVGAAPAALMSTLFPGSGGHSGGSGSGPTGPGPTLSRGGGVFSSGGGSGDPFTQLTQQLEQLNRNLSAPGGSRLRSP